MTDARGVVTSYSYDTLNRPTQVSYNVSGATGVPTTAGVTLTYGTSASNNNNGRLITMTDGVGLENYQYNNLGEMTQLTKAFTGGSTFTTGYAYNYAGQATSVTYPSGRVVQVGVDTIGRALTLSDTMSGTNTTYMTISESAYNAAQQVTGWSYGNGVNASFSYSPDRLQLQSLSYTKGSQTLYGATYSYAQNGGNTGQITAITDAVDAGRNATYSYDALYRLTQALTTGSTNYPQWGLSWSYDRYGNRWAQTATAGSNLPQPSVTVSATTNQITTSGYAYDASGNATNDGFNTLVYDAQNHAVSVSNAVASATYTYDANGLRVQKGVTSGTTTVYIFSGSKVIAEYDNGAAVGSPSREYIYSGGTLLAKIENSATVYYHQDGLSTRIMTDSSGNKLTPNGDQGHYPFGELWYPASALTKWLFTTYERDSESGGSDGNDYAMARFYRDALGRFNSPDPLSGSTSDPQSLDRYSYTENEPVDETDPSGTCARWGPGPFFNGHGICGTPQLGASDTNGPWGTLDFSFCPPEGNCVNGIIPVGPGATLPGSSCGIGPDPLCGPALPSGPTAQAKYTVNLKVLNDCLKSLGIKTTINSFTPSTPGGYGSASGVGEDAFTHGGNTVPITVTNDASSYNAVQITANAKSDKFAVGYTDPFHPYTDYTNNNNDAFGTVRTQVWELGNSLWRIQAGSPFIPWPKPEKGQLLDNCVKGHNGIQRQ